MVVVATLDAQEAVAIRDEETAVHAPATNLSHWTTVAQQRRLDLVHVAFLHRHGDRTPVFCDVGTKWKMSRPEIAFWEAQCASTQDLERVARRAIVVGPDPTKPRVVMPPPSEDTKAFGRLTQLGFDAMRAKGATLRSRYAAFVDAHHVQQNPLDQVYVQSSFVDRTVQSVECLLDGMFPPDEAGGNAPAFCIRTTPRNVLAPRHEWTLWDRMETFLKPEIDRFDPKLQATMATLRRELRAIVGLSDDEVTPWIAIGDLLICRKAHDLPLYDGITEDSYAQIRDVASALWYALYSRKEVTLESFEDGVCEIINHLRQVISSSEGPKISVFSAHDNSIVALLCALQVQHHLQFPVYGTVLAIEVYESQTTAEPFVRLLFEDKPLVFAGHEHEALIPFSFLEKRVQEFLHQ